MATNQIVENISAVKTPGAIPSQAITSETINGKRIDPANGVIATNKRNILLVHSFQLRTIRPESDRWGLGWCCPLA